MSTRVSGCAQVGKEAAKSQPRSPTHKQLRRPLVLKTRKHAALKGNPTIPVSAEQWININQAIVKTVEFILSKNVTLDSFGPGYWEMDEGFGIALIAEIRRKIKEICTLISPKLQKELTKMAHDVTHKEFRFSYRGGGVWFRFKMTNLQKAVQPIIIPDNDVPPNTAMTSEVMGDGINVTVQKDGFHE
ncbi:hypothetical protein F5Y02DRAFT_256164 [Annulohypoxylon stygium]|nr:hypothetical protein F5Y02DRAFT_256164 [Annulohypoxylon stygium]